MFTYTQGYEIDGSDTAYHITTPERERCIEILKYLLSLKVIDRDKPIEMVLRRRKHPHAVRGVESEGIELSYDTLETLSHHLSMPGITDCMIRYSYHSLNTLYFDVKREVVDLVAAMSPETKWHQFDNPVFCDDGAFIDEIYATFTPEGTQNLVETSNRAVHRSGAIAGDTGPFAIEIGISRGAPFGSVAYMVQKLATAFPELWVDAYTMIVSMYRNEGYTLSDKALYERIETPRENIVDALQHLVANDTIRFVSRHRINQHDTKPEETSTTQMEPPNLPRNLATYESRPELEYEFRDPSGKFEITRNYGATAAPEMGILKSAARGKNVLDISEYALFVRRLADATYFSDREYVNYTTVHVKIRLGGPGEEAQGLLRCIRRNGRIRPVLDVPCCAYEVAKKALNVS